MIRILLCCGGGFSSSAVALKLEKEIVEKHYDEQYHIEFYPFKIAPEIWDDFDIVICCPHLKIEINQYLKKSTPSIPIYIIPPRMYGMMDLEEILTDVEDIIDIYRNNPHQPVCFPGEENILRVLRTKAYRHIKK